MEIRTDFQKTGKLYPKLDAYFVSVRKECKGLELYLCSSCQFKTQKSFKQYLLNLEDYKHLKIKVEKASF